MKCKRRMENIARHLLYMLAVLIALLKGTLYILYYRFTIKSVRIEFPFKAFSKVTIIGPGSVFINKNCSVYKNVFRGLTIVTLSKSAKVTIGNDCCLGGLNIRCRNRIEIGNRTMTAISLVQDSLFVNSCKVYQVSNRNYAVVAKPIFIGENVWLGAQSCVLGGSSIGTDSVLAAGSLCYNSEFKKYSLISGSPAKRALPIDKIMKLKEK